MLPLDSARLQGQAAAGPARPAGPAQHPHQREPAWPQSAAKRRRLWVEPCRVTNEESAHGTPSLPPGKMKVGPKFQVPNPELGGTLGQRVSMPWLDAYYRGEPSEEDTDYWFTEPQGGWNQETRILNVAQEMPYTYASGRNPEFYNRRPIPDEWRPGTIVTGKVTKMMLFHGFQIDLGFATDGLVAMEPHDAAWAKVPHDFDLFTEVKARIHRIDPAPRARFPIQLELLEPAHAVPAMLPPELHPPSYDLVGLDTFEALEWGTGLDWRLPEQREPQELPQAELEARMAEFAGLDAPGGQGRRRSEPDQPQIQVPDQFPDDVL